MLHISTVSVFSFFSIIFLGGGHPIKDTAPQCQKIPVVALFVAPNISGSTHLTQFFHGAKRASNLVSIMAKKWLCLLWSPIFLLTKRYHTYHWWPMVQIPHFMGFCIPIFFLICLGKFCISNPPSLSILLYSDIITLVLWHLQNHVGEI